jgi:RND family efflux transporter MFP subunit
MMCAIYPLQPGVSMMLRRFYICLLFAFPQWIIGCQPEPVEQAAVIRPVRTIIVVSTAGERQRIFTGTAKAGQETTLSFKVSGTVLQLNIKVGDRVRKGSVIAALDLRDYNLRVQEAQAALVRSQAEARNASANYDRVRLLYENRSVSQSELDAARSNDESTRALVVSAQRQLDQARLAASYTRLTAPVDGSVVAVNVETGENVQLGQSIAVLASGQRVEVQVSIPESLITGVRNGDEVVAKFDALPGRFYKAYITEVGVATSAHSATYPVTARLAQSTPEVLPGMAANVQFTFESKDSTERFIVPPVSVGENANGRFVYTVDPAEEGYGLIRKQSVTVGSLTAQGLEVLSGLSDGKVVVTAGISKIKDGQKVKLMAKSK